ncbi:MAG: DUF1350 family protein [Cyanobium sp.]
MTQWRQAGDIWQLEPSGPISGTIEFIGGSYLAATPQLSYRRLLEALASRGWRILAWSYVPGFDHQDQANTAWRRFRQLREEGRQGVATGGKLLRLGHSLGCKLHLLAPDGGRACDALVALSFNNFSAERSVPLLAELGQQFNFRSEFSPSPEETLQQVARSYRQPSNLLVRFQRDQIDQSGRLLGVLQSRAGDATHLTELPGDHLAPASAGLRQNLLGSWADDPARQRALERIATTIDTWSPLRRS